MSNATAPTTENPLTLTVDEALRPYRQYFLKSLYIVTFLILGFWFFDTLMDGDSRGGLEQMGALLVIVAGLTPSFLWVTGRLTGLPILPAIAFYDIFWFAFPVIGNHPDLLNYPAETVFLACLSEAVFLIVITVVWFLVSGIPAKPPRHFRGFAQTDRGFRRLTTLCFMGITLAILNQALENAWLDSAIYQATSRAFRTPVRTLISLGALISVFILSFSIGRRALSWRAEKMFFVLFGFLLFNQAATLLLFKTAPLLMAATIGLLVGSGKLPWKLILIAVLAVFILHNGKRDMRLKYWDQQTNNFHHPIQIPMLPFYYAEWANMGLYSVVVGEDEWVDPDFQKPTSMFQRMSMIHMLVEAQAMAPSHVDYLYGATLKPIPQLIVPRIISPNKPRSHIGQEIMNVHFGMQSIEEAQSTFIAWGIASEAHANFGPSGIIIFGIFIGAGLGFITIWSRVVPMGSVRFLIALLLLSVGLQLTQSAVSLWLMSVYQMLLVLLGLSIFLTSQFSNERIYRRVKDEEHRRRVGSIGKHNTFGSVIERS